MDEEKRFELEEFVAELEGLKARHTELITVYVSAGYDLNGTIKQLEAEKSTAKNIKSKATQKNVIDALESLIRQLRLIKRTPVNGLALFAGNVSEKEGQNDFRVWSIEPPIPLNMRLYRCDQQFILDPLKEMLEATEVYGLVVIDRKEATLGVLEGKNIKVLQHMTSGVPGKTEKGGQCLSIDTLIMKDNGEILELKNSHNPMLVVSENLNTENSELTPVIEKWENEKQLFKIKTKNPVFEITASADHLFFVRTAKGIEEKPLSDIREGNYLLIPSKIDLSLETQPINFAYPLNTNAKEVSFPCFMDENLARVFGYYLGDGCCDGNRITFFEQRNEVAIYYKELLEEIFKIEAVLKFRKSKNYYQVRVYSKALIMFFKNYFNSDNKTLNGEIPAIVLKSPDNVLASFIAGFFDAEGYVSSSRIGLGINNKKIARQLQLALIRLGIISSLLEYDNRKNIYSKKVRYTIEISGIDSMKKFSENIGFASSEKNEKLKKLIERRGNQDHINQLTVNGTEVAKIIKNSGESPNKFHCPSFFVNRRQMSRQVFKRKILDKIENSELKRRLEFFYNSNLIITKINKIVPLELSLTIDIETKNHNFLANGIIVHNSAARYARIREGLAKEFFRRVADAMKQRFFDMPKLKGIIIGGPVPTKEDFLKEGQLVAKLKDIVLGLKDIGNTDASGLNDLVEASHDLLAQQEIIHEKKLLDKFLESLGKGGKAVYKKADVKKALDAGAVDTLIISKKLAKKDIQEMVEQAKNIAAKIELVSEETEEGQQFRNLGGIGALLRFAI